MGSFPALMIRLTDFCARNKLLITLRIAARLLHMAQLDAIENESADSQY